MPMLHAVNAAALMERTPFAIDDAKDDDDDDLGEAADDDQVMNEVCRPQHVFWLDLNSFCHSDRLMPSWRLTILA